MPSLSEQLQHLQGLKAEFDEALNNVKAMQNAKIGEKVQIVVNEALPSVKAVVKKELDDELSSVLAIKNEIQKDDLKKVLENRIDEKFDNQLENENFTQNLESKIQKLTNEKIDETLDNFKVDKLRFQNAASVLSLCVVNELASLSEAFKILAQIEFYENNRNKALFKVYQIK